MDDLKNIDWKKVDWKKNIRTNMSRLLLDLDTTLLEGTMKSNKVLMPLMIKRIWGNKDDTARISELLDQILKGDEARFHSFCKALEESDQKHIIELLANNSSNSRSSDETDSVPCPQEKCLPSFVRDQLNKNWNEIIDQLESNESLLNSLGNHGVFTPLQMKRLMKMGGIERNAEMLHHLERTSDLKFQTFCNALVTSNQEHILTLLNGTYQPAQQPASAIGNKESSCEKLFESCHQQAGEQISSRPISGKELVITSFQETSTDDTAEETSAKLVARYGGTTLPLGTEQCPNQSLESVRSSMGYQCEDSEMTEHAAANVPIHNLDPRQVDLAWTNQENVVISLTEAVRIEPHQHPAVRIPIGNETIYNDDQTIVIMEQRVTPQNISKVEDLIRDQEAYKTICNPAFGTQGFALVIANEQFLDPSLEPREGTKVDVKNLKRLLHYLNFEVDVQKNLTAQEILTKCKTESQNRNRRNNSVFVCCILSHGRRDTILGSDGNDVKIEEIVNTFDGKTCELLRGKPKIFMIQACQGDKKSLGVPSSNDMTDATSREPDSGDNSNILELLNITRRQPNPNPGVTVTDNIPTKHEKADIALVLATYPGFVAWRNSEKGSYFVQFLTDVFSKRAHEEHFIDMVTKVQRRMNNAEMSSGYKQICKFESTFDKKLYLLPR